MFSFWACRRASSKGFSILFSSFRALLSYEDRNGAGWLDLVFRDVKDGPFYDQQSAVSASSFSVSIVEFWCLTASQFRAQPKPSRPSSSVNCRVCTNRDGAEAGSRTLSCSLPCHQRNRHRCQSSLSPWLSLASLLATVAGISSYPPHIQEDGCRKILSVWSQRYQWKCQTPCSQLRMPLPDPC